MKVVIGYDPREHAAYEVCVSSLLRHASGPVDVIKLDEREQRRAGLYSRPYRCDEKGQFWDERDGRPFSVAFSFSRFLVPFIAPDEPVLFVDCDFLFLADVAELFALFDPTKAVQVVKHNHQPPDGVKMDAVSQARYHRKNWSSCVLWNPAHPANRGLTLQHVNHKPGLKLHQFFWLQDDDIGELPEAWNWLVGKHADISPTTEGPHGSPRAFHFTEGGPWFPDMQDVPHADEWLGEQGGQAVAPLSPPRRGPGRPRRVEAA